MKIGIDGNEANVERKVGVSEYAFELLKQFEGLKVKAVPAGRQGIGFRVYLKEKPREDLPKENGNWEYRIIGPKKLWTQFGLPFDLYFHKPRPDVFFTPTHYAPRFSPVPTVISVMDLSYFHFPQLFKASDLYQLRNWTLYSVKNAKKVLTISQASKNDIINYYNIEPGKVIITYPGIKLKAQMSKLKAKILSSNVIKNKYGIKGDYILFVGTIQPRKNLVRLIEAFSKIHPRGVLADANHLGGGRLAPRSFGEAGMDSPEVKLVIAGKKGWLYEEIFEAPKKFRVEDRVRFLDYVPDEDLPSLYQNAICFTLPSLYEGFGLPVLEAMANGCPVVISNTSSLPEVGGEAALYINPEDVNDIARNLESIIQNSELRKKLIEKGYQQVKKFSWEKTARETLKVLEEVAKKHGQNG